MNYVFNGKKLSIPGIEIGRKPFETDLKTHRNKKMIRELLKSDVNGMFLFYLYKNQESTGEGFIMPPGLSKEDTIKFQFEFMSLLERYAMLAKKR